MPSHDPTFITSAFIDGAFVDAASGETVDSIDPGTGKVIASVTACGDGRCNQPRQG